MQYSAGTKRNVPALLCTGGNCGTSIKLKSRCGCRNGLRQYRIAGAAGLMKIRYYLAELHNPFGIKAIDRFIQDEQLWISQHRNGNPQALFHDPK